MELRRGMVALFKWAQGKRKENHFQRGWYVPLRVQISEISQKISQYSTIASNQLLKLDLFIIENFFADRS